jgi:hypothetical protein
MRIIATNQLFTYASWRRHSYIGGEMRRTAARQSWVKQLRAAYPPNAAGHASIVMKFFVGSVDDELRMNQVIDVLSEHRLLASADQKQDARLDTHHWSIFSCTLRTAVACGQMNPMLTRGYNKPPVRLSISTQLSVHSPTLVASNKLLTTTHTTLLEWQPRSIVC